MAKPANRDLAGLPYPVTVDPMTTPGDQWIAANFDAAKRWQEPAGASEFDPDPPNSPNRGYCGTTEFDWPPPISTSHNPKPQRP